jgi:hypothetical protein
METEKDLEIADRFRFLDEEQNTVQDWVVTWKSINQRGNILIYFQPEFTPVANDSMFVLGNLPFRKIPRKELNIH